ncbi:SIMPL domain-containing protein [Solirhodobacter olei]|uniref:SIMPL domain-containing protein n=1 Tax=Solirhodobacter olei TaxID=2493082 RepID=UPI000FDCCE22|nr:SIMPL domain-containing protein [Solirhodobacter olei]
MVLWKHALAAAMVAGLAGLGGVRAAWAGPTLTVTGEGSVSHVPDMAEITLGVTAEGKTAAAAVAQASAQLAAVLKRLGAEGIAARDMQSSGLDLSPRWSNPNAQTGQASKIVGFAASGTVRVKVHALDRLGHVLDAVVSDGANRISGLSFGLSDPAPYQDAARKAAVADAMHRASVLAAAAGVKLGPVQSISEAGNAPVPLMRAAPMMLKVSSPVPVAQGEVDVKAEVQMVFGLSE